MCRSERGGRGREKQRLVSKRRARQCSPTETALSMALETMKLPGQLRKESRGGARGLFVPPWVSEWVSKRSACGKPGVCQRE